MKRFAKLTVFAFVCALLVVCLAIAPCAAKLSDIDNHWAKEYIEYGVEKGYISGYPDGTFLPNKTVTRAEFSKMLNSAVKITVKADADFEDVEKDKWYTEEVQKAVYAAYTTGYDDNTFRPNGNITRQEAAVFLSRVTLPVTQRADINNFNDSKDIDSWASDAVSMIAAKGYIAGDEEGRFLPKGQLTRSQAAKLIAEFVKNENIVNANKTIDKEVTLSETLFTGDVVVATEEDAKVVLENCRVLGALIIRSENTAVELKNSGVNTLENNADDNVSVDADGDSEIKVANINNPITIDCAKIGEVYLTGSSLSGETVNISGDVDYIDVATGVILKVNGDIEKMNISKKVNLVIQQGKIKNLVVSKNAKDSTINLSTAKVSVTNATNNAAVSYIGPGAIVNANNVVTGVEYENKPENVTGKDATSESNKEEEKNDKENTATTLSTFFENVKFSPTAKKTGVAVTTKITVTFDFDILNNKNKTVTTTYIEDYVELRKGTATGSQEYFTATFDSKYNKITIDPAEKLEEGKKYYLVFPAGTFYDANGNTNPKYTSYYFTTKSDDGEDEEEDEEDEEDEDKDTSVEMSPKNGATGVATNTTIKLTFDGTLKAYSSSNDFDADYVEDVIELHKGSATGDEVNFSASVTSKTITLTPSSLAGNTKYYVVIPANKIKVGSTTLSKTTLSFETEEGSAIEISPASGATGVSTTPEITISFNEPMLQLNGERLTEDYIIDEVVYFRKSSATKTDDEYQISYSVSSIAENNKKFVIVPDDELEPGVTYYIVVIEESLYGEDSETENAKVTSSFKTASAMAPMFYPLNNKENVSIGTDITISFSDVLTTNESKKTDRREVDDEYLAELVEDGYITFKRGSKSLDFTATIDGDGKTIIITPDDALLEEKTYTVSIKAKSFYSADSTSKSNAAGSASFSTNVAMSPTITPKNDAKDVAVTVKPTIKFTEKIFNNEGDDLKALYLKNTAISFVDKDGADVEFTASIDGSTITVTPKEDLESNVEYTLTLNAGTIQNEDGLTNAEKSVTFTTKVSHTIVMTVPGTAKYISPLVNPTVKFGTPLLTEDGDEVDAEYAEEFIFLAEKKTTNFDDAIPAAIEISADGRTFTIIPEDVLDFDTTYYINVVAKKFLYEDEETLNSAANTSFKTIKEPAFTKKVTASSSSKSTAKISYTANVYDSSDDKLAMLIVEDENGEVLKEQAITSASGSVTIKSLEADTEYTFYVYIVFDGEFESEKYEVTVTTKAK